MELTDVQYKESEIGVIPVDWEVKKLIEISDLATGNTPPTNDQSNYGDEFLFVSPADLGKGKWITQTEKKLSKKGFSISRKFPKNSILFTCIGSTIGKSGMAQLELTSNQQINAVIPSSKYANEFIFYALDYISPRIKLLAGEQAVPIVNKTLFGETLLAVPPTKSEQTAIATALSDTDALIENLEKLIDKKRNIKQGVMQELLKPKRGWIEKSFTELCDLVHGHQFLTSDFIKSNDGIKVIKIGNVQEGKFNTSDCDCISKERLHNFKEYLLKEGDILMSLTGNIGRVVVVPKLNEPLLQNYRVGKFVPKDVDKEFLAYGLASPNTTMQLAINSNQTSQANFGKQDFEKIRISIPIEREIQAKIADILRNMDLEIEFLERKLEKEKHIKQGMMQALLTGKIRLV